MRKMMILFSSLIFVGLGMTACSKEGSKKQPNFRNRNAPVNKTQAQGPAVGPQTGRGQTAGGVGNSKLQNPDSLGRHLSRFIGNDETDLDISCLIPTAEMIRPCGSVLVSADTTGKVTALKHTNGWIYSQGTEAKLNITEEDEVVIIAKLEVKDEYPVRKLKILQIMKDGAKATLPDDLESTTDIIKTDELLRDITDNKNRDINAKLKAVTTRADEHLIVITNVDKLINSEVSRQKRKELIDQLEQNDLRIVDAAELDAALEEEQAFLEAHIAQLSYRVDMKSTDGYTVTNVSVATGDEDAVDVPFSAKAMISDTRHFLIHVLDLDAFSKPHYKVTVELTKDE